MSMLRCARENVWKDRLVLAKGGTAEPYHEVPLFRLLILILFHMIQCNDVLQYFIEIKTFHKTQQWVRQIKTVWHCDICHTRLHATSNLDS